MGSKVLLADDSITIQKVVGIILANEDYELTVVDNGNAALDKAREIKPDVIMLDAIMPGKTGYEVCQEVRRDPQLKGTPLLLMTGAFEPFDEEKARQSGADDFISKPFESQSLIDRINQLIVAGKSRPAAASSEPPVVPESATDFVFDEESAAAADTSFDFDFEEEPVIAPTKAFVLDEAPVEISSADFAFDIEPMAPAAPVSTPPVEPMSVSPADFAFDEEPASATPAPVLPAAAPAMPADDDLWGVFDLDEATGGASGVVEAPVAAVAPAAPVDVFAEAAFETVRNAPVSETKGAAQAPDKWVPVDEQEFFFTESSASEPQEQAAPMAPASSLQDVAFAGLEDDFLAATVTSAPASSPVAPVVEQQFAPKEEYVPAPVQPVIPAAAPAADAITLSEAQLKDIVAKLSREVIERIVWEVVPDLAEVMIKEEIRKIRDGGI